MPSTNNEEMIIGSDATSAMIQMTAAAIDGAPLAAYLIGASGGEVVEKIYNTIAIFAGGATTHEQ